MSQPTGASANATIDEFDAAKAIVATLKGLERQQQERALRFATETLGLTPIAPHASASPVSATPVPAASTVPPATSARPLDIKQFTAAKAPKTDLQFAAVAAYYYRFEAPPEQRRDSINDASLKEAARLADRKRPSRMTLNNAKNRGYLDGLGGGDFRLNTVGENLVAVTLPGDEPRKKAAKKNGKPKQRKKSATK